jgi:integrase
MKKDDIKGKYIHYLRRKTKNTRKNNITPITVPVTPEIQHFIEKVKHPHSEYLLGKIKDDYSETTYKNKYRKFRRTLNKKLTAISEHLDLSVPLKLRTSRDSYASTLLRNGISKDNISSMLGHSNSKVTEHYLASIDLEKTFDINSVLPKIKAANDDDESSENGDSKNPKSGLQFLHTFSSN